MARQTTQTFDLLDYRPDEIPAVHQCAEAIAFDEGVVAYWLITPDGGDYQGPFFYVREG